LVIEEERKRRERSMGVPRCCTFIAWGTNKIHYSEVFQAVSARSSEDKLVAR
jgi:hypothetical protein